MRTNKTTSRLSGIGLLILAAALVVTAFPSVHSALAQTMGWSGGGGGGCGMGANYNGQNNRGYNQPVPLAQGRVTIDQARSIVRGRVARLNPGFSVSDGRDAGTHFEFDVKNGGQTVDRMAVDKSTGLVRPL